MKKKVILCLLIIFLVISFLSSSVRATNENDIMPIDEDNKLVQHVPAINDNIFALQEDITRKNEVVNGNLYLCGNNVLFESVTVNGDIFICANNLKIDQNTKINGNAYICTVNANIFGTIDRTIYAVSKDIVFDKTSVVGYEAIILADHILLDGNFYRNFDTYVNQLEIGENAFIAKDLNYASEVEAVINERADIQNINFSKQVKERQTVLDIVVNYVLDFVRYLVLTMLLFIIFIKLAPKFLQNVNTYLGVSEFGIGILSLVIIPLISLLMIAIDFTLSVAVVLLTLFLFILLISSSITTIAISSAIAKKSKKIKLPIWVAIITLISWILMKIPFIGGIVGFFMVATGLGIFLKYQVIKK